MSYPDRWHELNDEQKRLVERYIDTLLAQQLTIPLVQKPGREVVERTERDGVSYQLEKVKCGKDCMGCPHGPYWYAYYRTPYGKVVSKYVGKELRLLNPAKQGAADTQLSDDAAHGSGL